MRVVRTYLEIDLAYFIMDLLIIGQFQVVDGYSVTIISSTTIANYV
jgi:hypothetical protein